MDEQLNSIVKQLNRLAQKQTGLNPKAKTIERALKTFVDSYSGGGAGGDSIWGNITGSVENQTDLINKIDEMIDDELANFEHLDYEVVDTIPTPATAEEGVRYLYKPAGATAYNEYILIGGAIYNIGSTDNINLDNYYTKTEVDAELNGKADVSDLPTKTSDLTNDSQFVDKNTDQLTNYTTTVSMNNALNLKADKTTTYTKDEVNAKLDLKADADDIPTDTNQLTNGAGFITKSVNNLDNYTTTTALNTALNLKANAADIPTKNSDLTNDTGYIDANVNNLTNYTKTTDLNTALGLKADKSTTYTKTEVDTKLGDYYTETEVDTALNLKADKATTYTKTEVDDLVEEKVFGEILFQGTRPDDGIANFTLSKSAANYKYLEFFYQTETTTGKWSSVKVYEPNGKKVNLTLTNDNGSYLYLWTNTLTINGTNITSAGPVRWRFGTSGNPTRTNSLESLNTAVWRVVGYK